MAVGRTVYVYRNGQVVPKERNAYRMDSQVVFLPPTPSLPQHLSNLRFMERELLGIAEKFGAPAEDLGSTSMGAGAPPEKAKPL